MNPESMRKVVVLLFVFISCVTELYCQTAQDEVQRQQQIAIVNEQRAVQAEARAVRAEAQVKRMRQMAVALELAERSTEMQDKEISALMALQAYNFVIQQNESSYNNKIYNGLLDALKKFILEPRDLSNDPDAIALAKNTNNKLVFSALLPNSKNKVVADQNGNLKFVSEQGLVVRTLAGHRGQVHLIKFSHSGKLMATAAEDNTIRIWNLEQLNLRPILITEGHRISRLAFSSDDTQILYALAVKQVAVKQHPLDIKLMAATLCGALTRNFTPEEWTIYVANDLPYEETCAKK
jgi:hypothetical protein